ncbi:hypothetical protein SAMN00017477_1549 [Peptoniphilus asaccharolyticus DSM 20463]|uniref:Uncharacterized protein n=1 Tax=Peptoniphilus asaccharolyticus DSM 20463 TaxID=573058 RepID=A0A1W1VAH8_PEPAS|nr:hypothetical protein SAMN00017477_1549 [Peptoniphilus asaccharolyticus DSM 20463]
MDRTNIIIKNVIIHIGIYIFAMFYFEYFGIVINSIINYLIRRLLIFSIAIVSYLEIKYREK